MPSPRVTRLLSDPSARAVDSFWAEATERGTPLVEPHGDGTGLVTFLWRGEAPATRVFWGVKAPLTRIPGTDLWHGSQVLPSALRTVYCLVHGDAEHPPRDISGHGVSHVDPANPRRVHFPADPADPLDAPGWLSVLELPDAPPEPWTARRPGVTPGETTEVTLPGRALGGPRPVAVHRPAGLPTSGRPVLVVFDGFLARHVLRIPTVLDNLVAAGRIPPVVALFVSSFTASREHDLECTPGIVDFVTGELLPWARDQLNAGADHRANMIAGVSRGGLAAAHVGLAAPGHFGGVLAQSGSFWWPSPLHGEPGMLIREVRRRAASDVRFYLDVGTGETMPGPGGAPDQVTVVRQMRDALRERGFAVDYTEYEGGHDYVNWRRTFAEGLIAVAGVRS